MMLRERENAIVISPHQDDAVASAGNQLTREYKQVDVLNVFTRSNSHLLEELSADINVVSQIRQNEDRVITEKYNFMFHDGGFQDSEVRGVPWDNKKAPVDGELQEGVTEWLVDQLDFLKLENADLYLPAAFGLHPDHYLSLRAATSPQMLHKIGEQAVRLFVYADQPYYSEPQNYKHRGQDILTHQTRIVVPFICPEKIEMLSAYESQLSQPLLQRLGTVGAEFFWEVGSRQTKKFSEDVLTRCDVLEQSVFSKSEWVTLNEEAYQSEHRSFVDIKTANRNGVSISIPLMLDKHRVSGLDEVIFARYAGACSSDYMEFEGINDLDEVALENIELQLEELGVDAIWLSGIREDYPVATLMSTLEGGDDQALIPGVSSFRSLCDINGFDGWREGLNGKRKKKMRQIQRKIQSLEQYAEENRLSVTYAIKDLTPERLETFFRLQGERAEQLGTIDALGDKQDYRDLLDRAASQGLILVSEIKVGDDVISSMLLDINEKSKCVSIIAQGFDNDWSEYSPSFINMFKLIEYAHDKVFHYVDFLRGNEPYKYYFTDTELNLYKYVRILSTADDHARTLITDYIKSYDE